MKIILFTIICAIVLPVTAYADVIYFKSGGKVEGVITEETADAIVVDVGIGSVSVKKSNIERIESAAAADLELMEKKKRERDIELGKWAPQGWEEVKNAYLEAQKSKERFGRSKGKSEINKEEMLRLQNESLSWTDALAKKSKMLKLAEANNNIREYNAIIAEVNSITANVSRYYYNISEGYKQQQELDMDFMNAVSAYRANFQKFSGLLKNKTEKIGAADLPPDELTFCKTMKAKHGEMEADFKRNVIDCKLFGNHVIVVAVLNGKVDATLLVDTGASLVSISKDVASRLGVDYDSIKTTIDLILADGKKITAKPIVLNLVKVGEATVKDVPTVICENSPGAGVDGLLGMSFLSNFVMSVDAASNSLVLDEIK